MKPVCSSHNIVLKYCSWLDYSLLLRFTTTGDYLLPGVYRPVTPLHRCPSKLTRTFEMIIDTMRRIARCCVCLVLVAMVTRSTWGAKETCR